MSAAPTHRKGSMPKNGGPMRQRVSHHGTKPVIVPGARMKNTSDPSEVQKRRMVHPFASNGVIVGIVHHTLWRRDELFAHYKATTGIGVTWNRRQAATKSCVHLEHFQEVSHWEPMFRRARQPHSFKRHTRRTGHRRPTQRVSCFWHLWSSVTRPLRSC